MTCDKIQERFADYLTGDLDEAGRDEVREHIAACAACREDLENLTVVWAKLGVLPEEQPSGAVRSRFYAMLEEFKTADAPRPAWREWFSFRRPAFAASFSALLLLIGLGAGWLMNGGPAGRQNGSPASRARSRTCARRWPCRSSAGRPPRSGSRASATPPGSREPNDATLAALFDAVDRDPNPNVRLAAVEALYLFRDRPGVRESLVKSLSVQTYPLVQVALIDFLVEVREARAAAALKALVEGDELTPEVKKRAEQGLKQISL